MQIYQFNHIRGWWDVPLGKNILRIEAQSIHRERTGIHARLGIYVNDKVLSWSYCNLEKNEERTRLANSAAEHFWDEILAEMDKKALRYTLDEFCEGLWEAYLTTAMPEVIKGDAEVAMPGFYLEPYILQEGGTIMYAPPGRGKSNTALLWCISIDSGDTSLLPVQQAPTMYINLERSAKSFKRRIALCNRVLGLDPTRGLLTLNARGRSLADVVDSCRKAIEKYHIRVIFLDSISRAGYGSLVDDRTGNAVIDTLNNLCDTWVALAHTSRANESHAFGSQMFDAGEDIGVQLLSELKEDGTLGVGWQITKANDIGRYPLQIMAFEFDAYGLSKVRNAKNNEFPEIDSKRKLTPVQEIKEFILNQDDAKATTTQIALGTGQDPGNVSTRLKDINDFVKLDKVGREQYYGVAQRT